MLFHTEAQTGFRKAEVSLPDGERWDKSRAAMSNLSWQVMGVVHHEMTPELFKLLFTVGGYALLRPPPSKSDPLGLHWGASTIYLRFSATDEINAARTLATMELVRKVPVGKRDDTPLFVSPAGGAWHSAALNDLFNAMLTAAGVPDNELFKYSMHSWRIYLACALLAAGASNGTIQAMLRWRSDEALKIYARINDSTYADHLAQASQASVSSVRTSSLAQMMRESGTAPGQQHTACYDAWVRHAAMARIDPADASRLPTLSADGYMHRMRQAADNHELSVLADMLDKEANKED